MRFFAFFVLMLLICNPAFADKQNIKLRLLSSVNGASCRHVEIQEDGTGEFLELTTIDDLKAPVRKHNDSYRVKQIKRKIVQSGATTAAEIRTAVQGMEVDDEI